MVKALRIALVLVGLALALYGAASLTGGWLGEPPWWTRFMRAPPNSGSHDGPLALGTLILRREPVPGREVVSAGVVVGGLALATFSAWPRRSLARPFE